MFPQADGFSVGLLHFSLAPGARGEGRGEGRSDLACTPCATGFASVAELGATAGWSSSVYFSRMSATFLPRPGARGEGRGEGLRILQADGFSVGVVKTARQEPRPPKC